MNRIDPNTKILDRKQAKKQLEVWKNSGLQVVFTNGCFDVLHIGHSRYLLEAASLGDKLIVAINSDDSVKRLKGKERPINNQHDRAELLAAMSFIDAVVFFEEDTPYELISELIPDILVKGGDWKPEQIVGSDIVLAAGGEVKSLRFYDGHSTTATIDKIKKL